MKDFYKLTYEEINVLYPIEGLLKECGVTKLTDKGAYLSFSSPFREDRNPSMTLYKNSLGCIDFAGEFSGNLFSFVKRSLGLELYEVIGTTTEEVLNKKYFAGVSQAKGYALKKSQTLEDFKITKYEGNILYDFSKCKEAQDYLDSRFITEEFKQFFKIGYSNYCRIYRSPKVNLSKKTLYGNIYKKRICIPIIMGGTEVSIEGRDWTREQEKKCIYPIGGSTSYLFNYDNLDKTKPLILVEGIMDIPRIWTHITRNVSCIYGNQFTGKQKEQVKEFPLLIILSDKDTGGRQMITNIDKFYEDEYMIAQLEFGDPGDKDNSVEDIKRALVNKITSTEFLLNESELFEKTEITTNSFFSN